MAVIGTAIAAAVSSIGAAAAAVGGVVSTIGSTAIGSALLKAGASYAISQVANRIGGGGSRSIARPAVFRRTVSFRQSDAVAGIIYGKVRTGGLIAYARSSGSSNRFLHLIIVLAPHRVQKVGAIYFDGRRVANDDGVIISRFQDFLTIDKRRGTQGQSAFSGMVSASGGQWTAANHRLPGYAAVHLRLRIDADRYPKGIPEIAVDVYGKDDIRDPRTGTTGWTDNAALCAADYLTSNMGANAPLSALDDDALIEAANICDEMVGGRKRYTINGVADTSLAPRANIEAMAGAMAGSVIPVGGRAIIRAGAYRAPVYHLDLSMARGPVQFQAMPSKQNSPNGIMGTFISPAARWSPDSWPMVVEPNYLAQDGGKANNLDLPLAFTTDAHTAQRIARIVLRKSRGQIVQFPANLAAQAVIPGDTVTLGVPFMGIPDGSKFTVLARKIEITERGVGVALTLQATSAALFVPGEDADYFGPLEPSVVNPSDIPPAGAPIVTEALYVTSDGAGVKTRVFLTWDAPEYPYLSAYQVSMAIGDGPMIAQGLVGANEGVTPAFQIDDAPTGPVRFQVVAIGTTGVTAEPSETLATIIGDTEPPVALQDFSVASAGSVAVLTWQQSPDLDVRFGGEIEVRHTQAGGSWSSSQGVALLPGSETSLVTPMWPGVYLIRARDAGGRLGPVSQAATTGATALPFANVAVLQADPDWAGESVNMVASGGSLNLTGVGKWDDIPDFDVVPKVDSFGGMNTFGQHDFATGADLGSVRAVRLQSALSFVAALADDDFDTRPGLVDEWESWDGTDETLTEVVTQVRTTNDDPSASPSWGNWFDLSSAETTARAIQARVLINTANSNVSVRVTEARVHIDEVA